MINGQAKEVTKFKFAMSNEERNIHLDGGCDLQKICDKKDLNKRSEQNSAFCS